MIFIFDRGGFITCPVDTISASINCILYKPYDDPAHAIKVMDVSEQGQGNLFFLHDMSPNPSETRMINYWAVTPVSNEAIFLWDGGQRAQIGGIPAHVYKIRKNYTYHAAFNRPILLILVSPDVTNTKFYISFHNDTRTHTSPVTNSNLPIKTKNTVRYSDDFTLGTQKWFLLTDGYNKSYFSKIFLFSEEMQKVIIIF